MSGYDECQKVDPLYHSVPRFYSFPKRQNPDSLKLKTLDENFKSDENGRKFSKRVEKPCGKGGNCSFRAISPFPTVFLKRRVLQTC